MECNKANSFQNILLDINDVPINISLLSTSKALNINTDLIVEILQLRAKIQTAMAVSL